MSLIKLLVLCVFSCYSVNSTAKIFEYETTGGEAVGFDLEHNIYMGSDAQSSIQACEDKNLHHCLMMRYSEIVLHVPDIIMKSGAYFVKPVTYVIDDQFTVLSFPIRRKYKVLGIKLNGYLISIYKGKLYKNGVYITDKKHEIITDIFYSPGNGILFFKAEGTGFYSTTLCGLFSSPDCK